MQRSGVVKPGPDDERRRLSARGRHAVAVLACLVGLGVFGLGAVTVSAATLRGGDGSSGDDLTIINTGRVSFSAVVRPHGRRTTAYFEYGLATRYREPRPSHLVYDESTPMLHLSADFGSHFVAGKASKLIPNALYHVRLVAQSSAGKAYSPPAAFTTDRDAAPSSPRIGATVNLKPVSGLVLLQPPPKHSALASELARLVEGPGFLPLTEPREVPIDAQIDARAGAVQMVVAGPQGRQTQRVKLAGALFSLSQPRRGPDRGLTTVDLNENDFPAGPTYNGCSALTSGAPDPDARTDQASSLVVQSLRARDQAGRFRTQGRYSAATATSAGTVWDTIDGCDGTLTTVQHGTVSVSDFGPGTTVVVDAGQSYLAAAQ